MAAVAPDARSRRAQYRDCPLQERLTSRHTEWIFSPEDEGLFISFQKFIFPFH